MSNLLCFNNNNLSQELDSSYLNFKKDISREKKSLAQDKERIEESNEEICSSPSPKRKKSQKKSKKRDNDATKKTKSKGKKLKNNDQNKKERVKLINLFTEGLIREGEIVKYREKCGKINNKGSIFYKEKIFNSPSGWATEINKELGGSVSTRPNGWHDVFINGNRLSSLREKYETQTSNKVTINKGATSNINQFKIQNFQTPLEILAMACFYFARKEIIETK